MSDINQETPVDEQVPAAGAEAEEVPAKQEEGVPAGEEPANGQSQAQVQQNQPPPPDEDDRKLFVGGIPAHATEDEIRQHFAENAGPVESINLKTDQVTGRSRGFCFIVFETLAGLEAAVAAEKHTIKGRDVAVKKAQAKPGKVYVGKLQKAVEESVLREFFSKYGTVTAVEQPFDRLKNEKKNFCFISFEKEEPAKRLLKEGSVFIDGQEVEIKKVTPKADNNRGGMMGGRGGGAGGGPMPWGSGGYQQGGWGQSYGGYYGAGGYGGYGASGDPYGYGGAGAAGAWGGYGGGGWGSYDGNGSGYSSGGYSGAGYSPAKAPRGRGAARGRGASFRGQRPKPY